MKPSRTFAWVKDRISGWFEKSDSSGVSNDWLNDTYRSDMSVINPCKRYSQIRNKVIILQLKGCLLWGTHQRWSSWSSNTEKAFHNELRNAAGSERRSGDCCSPNSAFTPLAVGFSVLCGCFSISCVLRGCTVSQSSVWKLTALTQK